jgi:ABC-type uncharacterized transport system substrate-binding protein
VTQGRVRLLIAGAGAGLAVLHVEPSAPGAHPHVWITSVMTFVFEDRRLFGLRHRWEFDEIFGSFVIQEHDADGNGAFDAAETESVKDKAFASLRDYGYFTHLRIDGQPVPLTEIVGFEAEIEDGVLAYEFTLSLPEPVDPAATPLAVGVYDEEYYVEVLLDQDDPVRFAGLPNGACTFEIEEDAENPIYFGMVDPLSISLSCGTS